MESADRDDLLPLFRAEKRGRINKEKCLKGVHLIVNGVWRYVPLLGVLKELKIINFYTFPRGVFSIHNIFMEMGLPVLPDVDVNSLILYGMINFLSQ